MLSNRKMIVICILQYIAILAYHLIYSYFYGTMDQTMKCGVWSVCILILMYCFCKIFSKRISLVINFTMISVLVTVTFVGIILNSLAFSVAVYFASGLIVSLFLNKAYTLTWCIESTLCLIGYTIFCPEIILKMVPSLFLFYGYIFVYFVGCVNAFLLVVFAQKNYNELKNEALQAQLEGNTKNIFWGNISNEIRTPMNVINGMSQLLKTEPLNDRAKEYTDQIENASDILLNIVNDTVTLSQIETGILKPVMAEYDLYNVIHMSIMNASRSINEKNVNLVYCINPNVPATLIGDEEFLRSVITKLLSNALLFTTEGEVRVEVEIGDKQKTKKDYSPIIIKIKDSGIGISPDEIENIFKGFDEHESSRTTEQESVGLSLKLCKSMVELLGGTLDVESTLGVGTTFTISIVQQIGNEVILRSNLAQSDRSYLESFSSIKANVLVVDDTPTNLKLIAGMIKLHGINPDSVDSGSKCISVMKDKKYDIVLLDIMMSGFSGEDTLREIRRLANEDDNYKNVPIVALTTKSIIRDRERFISMGFDDFISKPVDDKELVSLLKKYLKNKY